MVTGRLSQARILICDDQEGNVLLLQRILEHAGYANVLGTTDGERLVELCAQLPPDLILLDLHMPVMDGFEVMRRLKSLLEGPWLPILVLTGDTTSQAKQRALSAGARDFVTKPLDQAEVLLRIANLLETRFLHLELSHHNMRLGRTVRRRTRDLEEARVEILERLALAAEYRDDATGEHAQRVGTTAALLYQRLDRPPEEAQLIRQAATLHDVGKIGIPDSILLKPGRLTPREWETMKRHVEVSRSILSGSRSPLLRLAEEIAVSHHERWDGRGYPSRLRGDQIPLPGRVTAIADVFDALTHERPYKPAWPVEQAVEEICAQRGGQFDPSVVDAFTSLDHERLLGLAAAPSAQPVPGNGRQPAAVT